MEDLNIKLIFQGKFITSGASRPDGCSSSRQLAVLEFPGRISSSSYLKDKSKFPFSLLDHLYEYSTLIKQ